MREIVSPLDGFASPFGPQRGFNPLRIFANDEPGAWFEANDSTTLFTDVAGTTPVTAPGDAVALQLDKSGRGNHRTQATVAARPLYALHPVGGVRNKLEYTEDSDFWKNAAYTKNATSDPFGGNKGILAECGSFGRATISDTLSLPEGETYTFSIWVKAGPSGVASFSLYFREQGGDFTIYGLGPATNSSDAWTRYEVSGVKEADGNVVTVYLQNNEGSAADFYVFGPQLEEGSTATNYQRVGSFLDVSEEGKARRGRIWYNGTSHFMETGTITPGTDKAQVFAGVRKLSDAAQAALTSFGDNTDDGSVETFAPRGTTTSFRFGTRSGGTVKTPAADARGSEFDAPITVVFTSLCSIPEDLITLRIDGAEAATSTADQGSGNYLAYPLYFGARGGTSLFFNGYEDTSIIRFGPNLDDTTISKVESYVASKTPEGTI